VGVQIVHHQDDFFGIVILAFNRFKKFCPVLFCPLRGYARDALAGQWLASNEDVAHPFPAVFVIITGKLTWLCWNWHHGFSNQLFRRLVHANQRIQGIIGQFVQIQDRLHLGHKITVMRGRDYPCFCFPGLKLVFFSVCRTVS